jgi:putative ABC transport system permease protein
VIVIDDLTADQLFGTTEVLGQKIDTTIQGMEFEATIIGVCKRLDISEGQLDSEQGFAYVPITMLDNHLADYDMQRMLLTIKDIQIDEAKAKIIHFLKDKGIALHQEDMKLANQVELIDAFAGKNKVIFAALSILWFTLAMISLINIMLVDIERSKTYYGLLKFYGRSESAIRKLVYLKAYATAMACSICSIGLGLATSFAVCYMLHIPIHISIHSISLGLLLPMIICLLSAVYPAWKASSIDMNNAIWRVE